MIVGLAIGGPAHGRVIRTKSRRWIEIEFKEDHPWWSTTGTFIDFERPWEYYPRRIILAGYRIVLMLGQPLNQLSLDHTENEIVAAVIKAILEGKQEEAWIAPLDS